MFLLTLVIGSFCFQVYLFFNLFILNLSTKRGALHCKIVSRNNVHAIDTTFFISFGEVLRVLYMRTREQSSLLIVSL